MIDAAEVFDPTWEPDPELARWLECEIDCQCDDPSSELCCERMGAGPFDSHCLCDCHFIPEP